MLNGGPGATPTINFCLGTAGAGTGEGRLWSAGSLPVTDRAKPQQIAASPQCSRKSRSDGLAAGLSPVLKISSVSLIGRTLLFQRKLDFLFRPGRELIPHDQAGAGVPV